MRCPICQGPLPPEKPASFPFCSPRCRTIDLARWLDGDYRIPSELVEPEPTPLASSSEQPSWRGSR
ncbi:MAG: DNA gyrase inhibitor YacG [Myxococcales bacterium]|nr:DNA gyrase inhibitor YacG [Polyangiaceae bacterium]MDW8250316.1 DNA gyrase inhibitor YacG [Myxococcales bacterium]